MRAIIIAAGRGKRMEKLSADAPKCLLEVNGRSILRHQIDTLRSCGIDDIVVIKGYKKDLIDYPDVRYRVNDQYLDNNILHSLFFAEQDIEGDVLVTYGDILYKPEAVRKISDHPADISVVVDTDWLVRYRDRTAHPANEAENVVMGPEDELLEIGKILNDKKKANAEFIGMMKLSPAGTTLFKEEFHRLKGIFTGRAFQRAKIFSQAYLTDMLQQLLDSGQKICCVPIKGGWLELDTPEDYAFANKVFS